MSKVNRNPIHLTILAMAVLSLSACSTTSNTGGFDFGGIGAGIGKIGSKTAEIGSSAWEGTKNVLNIGEQKQETHLLDEVDLALMEDDAIIENAQSAPAVQQVQIGTAEIEPVLPRNALKPTNAQDGGKLAFGEIPDLTASEKVMVPGANEQQSPGAVPQQEHVANTGTGNAPLLDLTHVVQDNENLWQIAKITTGDANNWHILADINNLPPNASVFVGQKLTIPADMVNSTHGGVAEPYSANVAQSTPVEPVKTLTEQAALTPPAAPAAAQPAAPGKEAAAVALTLPEAQPESAPTAIKLPDAKPEPVAAAATPVLPAEPAETINSMSDALALEVGVDETLWDFAKRTTGDATNWKTIAAMNGYSEQQLGLIRPGQKINVPTSLIRARDENGTLIAKGEEATVPNAKLGGVAPTNAQAIAATAAVLTGTNNPTATPAPDTKPTVAEVIPAPDTKPTVAAAEKTEAAEEDIKIVEAAFQDKGAIKPVTAESLSKEASQAVASNDAKMGKVMVKGTYYPKAVYNNADFSSSLLMRVSPGTQLLVSKAIGPWLEVKTEKGIGYVHSRDIK